MSSLLEQALYQTIKDEGLPLPEKEFLFCVGRKWRFDFAYPNIKLAIEVEGGINEFARGRHMRAEGFIKDCEKYNKAALLGWRLLRYTTHTIPYVVDDLKIEFKNNCVKPLRTNASCGDSLLSKPLIGKTKPIPMSKINKPKSFA